MDAEPTSIASHSKREYFTRDLPGDDRVARSSRDAMIQVGTDRHAGLAVDDIEQIVVVRAGAEVLGRLVVVGPQRPDAPRRVAGVLRLVVDHGLAHHLLVVDAGDALGLLPAVDLRQAAEARERDKDRGDGKELGQIHATPADDGSTASLARRQRPPAARPGCPARRMSVPGVIGRASAEVEAGVGGAPAGLRGGGAAGTSA